MTVGEELVISSLPNQWPFWGTVTSKRNSQPFWPVLIGQYTKHGECCGWWIQSVFQESSGDSTHTPSGVTTDGNKSWRHTYYIYIYKSQLWLTAIVEGTGLTYASIYHNSSWPILNIQQGPNMNRFITFCQVFPGRLLKIGAEIPKKS